MVTRGPAPALAIRILVPGPLREYCGGASELRVSATDVGSALEALERLHPALHRCVCDETGAVRRHVNVFVNSLNVRDGEGLATGLAVGDVVSILPAVSGG
jgi:molybdopterin synthase sulfur carrier subunit